MGDVLMRTMDMLNAGAAGDALGYRVEFDSKERIEKEWGADGPESVAEERGEGIVSDDTQMTLFVLEGLLAARTEDEVGETVRSALNGWFETQRSNFVRGKTGVASFCEMWARRAPGSTCVSALSSGGIGSSIMPTNDSKGCGSVMRSAPFGLAPFLIDDASPGELAFETSFITHGHREAALSSMGLAEAVFAGLSGEPAEKAFERMTDMLSDEGESRALELCREALRLSDGSGGRTPPRVLGEGWVAEEALAIGVWAAAEASKGVPRWAAIRAAANHGGDSDSTASIAGNLIGALLGADERIRAEASRLDARRVLDWFQKELARRLTRMRQDI